MNERSIFEHLAYMNEEMIYSANTTNATTASSVVTGMMDRSN
jgi:hypothetical protein